MPRWLWLAVGWHALASALAVVVYGLDKRRARLGRRRIPERVLHAVELAGGWPGALIAARWFRHKTRKVGYRVVLGAIVVSLVRRFFFKPLRLRIDDPKARIEAAFILGLIFVLILLMYGIRGTEILMDGSPERIAYAPVSYYVAGWMSDWGMDLPVANGLFAWVHHLIIFFFLLYIPFSKHIHILGAVPNVFFRNLGPAGTLNRMDFEDETAEKFGVSEIQEFTWKQLLDLYACTECGRCQAACPAFLTDKPLSPYRVIHRLRGHLMRERGALLGEGYGESGAPQLIPDTVTEDEFFESKVRRIVIFLSLFNVHVNYVPFSGKVDFMRYARGKNYRANSDRASSENGRGFRAPTRDQVTERLRQRASSEPLLKGKHEGLLRILDCRASEVEH